MPRISELEALQPETRKENKADMSIAPNTLAVGAYYRHKKTGGAYQIVMFATIEATMVPAVIYAARRNGETERWIRPVDEFCDGRFEPVEMSAHQ